MDSMTRPQHFRTTPIAVGTTLLMVIAVLVLWQIAPQRWAPYRTITSACVFCGAARCKTARQGKMVEHDIFPNEVSRWVQSLHPEHTDHTWVMVSVASRESWFGRQVIGCGGGPETTGAYYAFLATQKLGAAEGERYLSEFHKALTRPTDQLVKHVEQMQSEIEGATAP